MSEIDVIQADVRALREDFSEIKGVLAKVADALERLARLEERHSTVAAAQERAFSALGKIETRVRELEMASPVQKLTTGWMTNGVWLAAGGAVTIVLKKIGVM